MFNCDIVRAPLEGGCHGESGHGGYARQGLAAETEGTDVFEVVKIAYLARGVPRHGELDFVGRYAAPVILHADERLPAVIKAHIDMFGTSIQAVLNEFLEDARRPLDDFAGRYLVAQFYR